MNSTSTPSIAAISSHASTAVGDSIWTTLRIRSRASSIASGRCRSRPRALYVATPRWPSGG